MTNTHDSEIAFATWLREACAEVLERVFGAKSETVAREIAKRWGERHRVWHGYDHLRGMLGQIDATSSPEERHILHLAAIFHDAVYDSTRGDNEDLSARLLERHANDPTSPVVVRALQLIIDSKWDEFPTDPLSRRFFDLDATQLADVTPLGERLRYEISVFREYQWAPLPVYREKRAEFLRGWAARFPQHARGVAECLELLRVTKPRIGVYPGSFDPFHRGHLSILRQAEQVFDKVLVAVGINRQKLQAAGADATNMMEARSQRLRQQLRFHEVTAFGGLLTDFVDGLGYPVTIVRGVRDGTDLEAELRLSRFINELRPGSNIVWISCEAELQHLSSSAIRELESIEPGAGQRYVADAGEIYNLSTD